MYFKLNFMFYLAQTSTLGEALTNESSIYPSRKRLKCLPQCEVL